MDKAELEMGDVPPSRSLAAQSGSIGPGVLVRAPQSESPSLSGLANEIESVV